MKPARLLDCLLVTAQQRIDVCQMLSDRHFVSLPLVMLIPLIMVVKHEGNDVVKAVDEAIDILVDGGVRRGTDIIKALALGAKAVMVGRPILWGLAVEGQAGVEHILAILRQEYDIALANAGITSSKTISKDIIFTK